MALTKQQQVASEHFKGPALTLAIPGSGKTTLLLHRLIYLVTHHGVKPEEILTLTFSKASALDMSSRYHHNFGSTYTYAFEFMTIHKFAYRIYKTYCKNLGKKTTLIEDGPMKFKVLSQIFRKFQHSQLTEDAYETLSNQIGLIYNLMLKRTDATTTQFDWDNIFEMAEAYHLFKKENHLFDFDDMLLDAIRILKKHPQLLKQMRQQYPYIQVDEAQDTSKLQYALIELLLCEDQNLFVVADDDQSIYGFRGAYPQYLLDFPRRFSGAKLYYLTENFRSDANIVQTASGIIAENKIRFDKEMQPTKPASTRIPVRIFGDLIQRNHYLIQHLSDTAGTKAVLYRNKVAALSIIDALDCANLDFQIKDSPLHELKHWMMSDLLAFFNLILIPQDLESFKRIAFKTNGFISKEMRDYVISNHRGRNIFDVLVEIPFLESFQTKTQEKLKAHFEIMATLRPYDAIHYIETELGYLDYIKKNSSRLSISMNFARTRLDAYKAIAKPLKTSFDFIQRVDALEQVLSTHKGNSGSAVTLSTIHGSKGLEFDHVYMIDVNAQIFPGFKATETQALEEERRLFYVGLTRAITTFELLHSEFINGAYNPNSTFIEELLRQPLTDHRFNNVTGKPATG